MGTSGGIGDYEDLKTSSLFVPALRFWGGVEHMGWLMGKPRGSSKDWAILEERHKEQSGEWKWGLEAGTQLGTWEDRSRLV